jgi:hypothetical protein
LGLNFKNFVTFEQCSNRFNGVEKLLLALEMGPKLFLNGLLITEDQFSDLRERNLLFEACENFRNEEFKQLLQAFGFYPLTSLGCAGRPHSLPAKLRFGTNHLCFFKISFNL